MHPSAEHVPVKVRPVRTGTTEGKTKGHRPTGCRTDRKGNFWHLHIKAVFYHVLFFINPVKHLFRICAFHVESFTIKAFVPFASNNWSMKKKFYDKPNGCDNNFSI